MFKNLIVAHSSGALMANSIILTTRTRVKNENTNTNVYLFPKENILIKLYEMICISVCTSLYLQEK